MGKGKEIEAEEREKEMGGWSVPAGPESESEFESIAGLW